MSTHDHPPADHLLAPPSHRSERLPPDPRRDTAAVLQRAAGNSSVSQMLESEDDPHGIQRVLAGGGSPLPEATRSRMESSFGADFADVRLHTGEPARRSTTSLRAAAYTVGEDIVMGDGYSDSDPSHQHTLAHELTHVVQQRSGPVEGNDDGTGVSVSDPGDRFEREAVDTANAVTGGGSASVGGDGSSGTLQRQALETEESEDELQRQPLCDARSAGEVQRESSDDEDELTT